MALGEVDLAAYFHSKAMLNLREPNTSTIRQAGNYILKKQLKITIKAERINKIRNKSGKEHEEYGTR